MPDSFPHFAEKHRFRSLITPEKQLEYRKATGRYPSFPAPDTFIFCYQSRFFEDFLKTHNHTQCDGCFYKVYFLNDYPGVAIGEFGIGAPVVAQKLELLIAWGVKRFISIGTAGSLQKDLAIGDIVVCEKAIRDEGTSHHYLPYAKYSYPSESLKEELVSALEKSNHSYRRGTSWTIDTVFRQTKEEIEHYQKEGVLCVEMEASALFAIASLYDVEIASLFTISDTHAELEWKPFFDDAKTKKGLTTLFQVALNVGSESKNLTKASP